MESRGRISDRHHDDLFHLWCCFIFTVCKWLHDWADGIPSSMGQAQEVDDQTDINNVEDCTEKPDGLGLVDTVPLNKEEVRNRKRSTYIRTVLDLTQEILAAVFVALH